MQASFCEGRPGLWPHRKAQVVPVREPAMGHPLPDLMLRPSLGQEMPHKLVEAVAKQTVRPPVVEAPLQQQADMTGSERAAPVNGDGDGTVAPEGRAGNGCKSPDNRDGDDVLNVILGEV
ncbi:hypothetical protein PInf_008692 [Phytophthora infestans]|nr:hypothetical protein PInf_008692 [Phytophthora infestans]